jgi:ligand-binding sensor domain-containing protein
VSSGFLFLFFASAVALGTEAHQYSPRIWQADSGLPSQAVESILQTRDGYLWVGTQNGLARFDGIGFTVFDRNNVPEMSSVNILGLHESRDGALWIATGSGGVLRLSEGRFVHYGKAEGLATDFTLGPIVEAMDGALWFGTVAGLSRFKEGKFSNFNRAKGLSNNAVRDLCEDRQGTIWIATGAGVDFWPRDGQPRPLVVPNRFKGKEVRTLCCDRDGTVWFGFGNELGRLQEGRLTTFPQGKGLPYNIIARLYPDRHGNIWVGSHGGLSRFVNGQFVPQPGSDGLPLDLVNAAFEDREENLWIGSRDGLTQLRAKRFETYSRQEGLPNNNVMSVLEDRGGTVWVGTWGGGLTEMKDGAITVHTNQANIPVLTLALHEDRSGQLWAGTDFGAGLFCLGGDSLRHFGPGQGLPNTSIRVIFEDRRTNLWVGTGSGLYLAKDNKFKNFGASCGIGGAIVREIHEDRAGNFWVATEAGLWRLGQDQKWVKFTKGNGLSANPVIALYEDAAGDLWVGTAGGGLDLFHNGKFSAITTREGLFSDVICEILEDDHGWVWMSCPRGVFRVKREELELVAQGRARSVTSIAYGRSDGMLSELCNGVAKPGAWKGRDGRLWFATSKGVCVIDPDNQASDDRSLPPVVLERVLADKQPFPLEETLPVRGRVRVRPGNRELEFHYTALSFRAPERNQFKYKLDGADPDWVEAGSRRVAYYRNLSPGTYHFRVIARDNNSGWTRPAEAEIVLLPQFWQTGWFQLAVAAGIGLFVFGVYRLRLARFREIERLRLRLAADLHDDVGSNLSTISLLSRRAQKQGTLREEVKEDLAAINRISLQTANAIREIVWLINPEYDTIDDLVVHMKDVANVILSGIEHHFESPRGESSRKLTMQFRQNFFLWYKEALTNVARHSQASRVEISFVEHERDWQLTVRDNGIGFDPSASFGGSGLKNLRLRASRLNGAFVLDSGSGRGTTVSLSVKFLK